jgi:hypothetical protein
MKIISWLFGPGLPIPSAEDARRASDRFVLKEKEPKDVVSYIEKAIAGGDKSCTIARQLWDDEVLYLKNKGYMVKQRSYSIPRSVCFTEISWK